MQIRVGYELIYDCPQPTPMILTLHIHFTRASDVIVPDHLITSPSVPITAYRDAFGNWCSRIVAPKGEIRLSTNAIVNDRGEPDVLAAPAQEHRVQDLPEETLVFLLGSRYCETDLLSEVAWGLFGKSPNGWGRVQAICDFVHQHIAFDYKHARATKTAWEAFNSRVRRQPCGCLLPSEPDVKVIPSSGSSLHKAGPISRRPAVWPIAPSNRWAILECGRL